MAHTPDGGCWSVMGNKNASNISEVE
jgi:hypothetical protein